MSKIIYKLLRSFMKLLKTIQNIDELSTIIWNKEIFGTDVYHLVAAFIMYSVLGWLVESIYMSICERKIVNRGFGKGPFCPIYGFGAVIGYIILSPLAGHYFYLYITGAVLATIFEFLVGKLMIKCLGDLWWDYNEKPFNYKGIICLESTLAWGVYALIIIGFLNNKIVDTIDKADMNTGEKFCIVILLVVVVDYMFRFYHIYRDKQQKKMMSDVEADS